MTLPTLLHAKSQSAMTTLYLLLLIIDFDFKFFGSPVTTKSVLEPEQNPVEITIFYNS